MPLAVVVCCSGACAAAQESGDVPDIRVETEQVLVPTLVSAWVPYRDYYFGWMRGYYRVLRLGPHDFHLFEDNEEQTITSATLARPFRTDFQRDNLGYQQSISLTPRGVWTILRLSLPNDDPFAAPFYGIAFRPPMSSEGSCHTIKITIDPKDTRGHKLVTADSAPLTWGNVTLESREEKVERSKLLLRFRTQFCKVSHAASDPLYGTLISKHLERLGADDGAAEDGFNVSAIDLLDESGRFRIHVALDFPQLSTQTGNPGFQAALLGMFNRANGDLAARFSDSKWEGLDFPTKDPAFNNWNGREYFYSHYETEVDLPPWDYEFRAAIDFGGAMRRADAQISVPAPAQRLAVSGIALCRRYFEHSQISNVPQSPPDGIHTMPIEMKPLVSKGIEFTPTGDTRFKKDDPMAAYFEVYEPLLVAGQLLGDGSNVHAQFEIRVADAKTGDVKFDTGFRPADGFVNLDSAVIPISEKIAIGELGPGEYRLQVRAMDSAGNTTDWRTTPFTRE